MHLITGYAGYEHITSANDGAYNSHVFGTGKYVFDSRSKFEANVISPNAITIGDGEGMINGRYFEIPKGASETATIENGTTSSVNRIDLIVARYELNDDTGIETVTLTVIKGEDSSGEPVVPAYYDGSILEGNGFVDLPLYKVHINGINIGDIETLFEIAKDVPSELAEINANLSELTNKKFGAFATLVNEVEYITPSDGYFRVHISTTGAGNNKYVNMYCNSTTLCRLCVQPSEYTTESVFVRKGSRISYAIGTGITDASKIQAMFLPLNG